MTNHGGEYPTTQVAMRQLLKAFPAILKQDQNPLDTLWLVDIGCGPKRGHWVRDECPCLLRSRPY
eukprot:6088494-Alexandrium_andersonii.AAC.1